MSHANLRSRLQKTPVGVIESHGKIPQTNLIRIGNLVADDLRSRGFQVLDVPDELELTEAIA
ncbi:MAG: hypothetical protein RID53_08025 [Coleofasciculus sp. B1-GNL1-01]|uniref:hypothetical protein n=1 Tax=Coleofasciculus sp. B1-GNL1-01 TaxID=3068484 RepID=UPI0032F27378